MSTTLSIAFNIGLIILLLGDVIHSHLNVYLNLHEIIRLLNVSAEVYYVRDGQVNEYALNIVIPVPENINEISFTWQTLAPEPLPYSINIATADASVLPLPTLNISRVGEIPLQPQTFGITMKCSGSRDAEVEITITMEIILDYKTNNVTELVFKRKKQCLANSMHESRGGDSSNIMQDSNLMDDDSSQVMMEKKTLEDIKQSGLPNHIMKETDPLFKETIAAPNSGWITLIIGGIGAVILVTTLIFIAYCARGPSKRPNHGVHLIKTASFQPLPTISLNAHNSVYACPSSIAPTYATLTRSFGEYELEASDYNKRLMELNVQKCRVRLSCLIQEGAYGRVYRGTYNGCQEILVKTVAQRATRMQVNLLLQESMMLYEFSHPNILSLLGVSTEDYNTPFVVYPSNKNTRNLKLLLQDLSYSRNITSIQTVLMSTQLAMAIEHLHNHGFLHKDIATRNCMIDDQLHVKLCDNSLSRDLFPNDYHCLGDGENRPIKWMSLEALQKAHYNEGGDVWSFGVMMWEICTFAKMPYVEIDANDMEHYLRDGYRLAQPYNCPDELYTIMSYCWAALPSERPTMAQLQICLSEFHTQITRYV